MLFSEELQETWGYFIIRWSKLLALLCLKNLHFSLIWTVQPLSDCLAERSEARQLSDLGWTARPRLDNCPDLRKWKLPRNKETSLSSFVTSEQSFKCSTEHLSPIVGTLFSHTSWIWNITVLLASKLCHYVIVQISLFLKQFNFVTQINFLSSVCYKNGSNQ